MIFKKVMSVMLAADFAMGAFACGVKKAEERTVEKMSAYIEEIEDWKAPVSTEGRYVKRELGVFSLTFYVPDAEWGYQTSTGARSTHLKTCAVDPSVIPLGSTIMITGNNGQKLYLKAVDIGGGIRGSKIDIFFDSNLYGGVSTGYKWIADFGTIHSVYLLEE